MIIYDLAIDKQQLLTLEEESDGNPVEICKLPAGSTFIRMENIGDCLHIIYSIGEPDTSTLTLDIGSTADVPDFFSDDPQASNYRIKKEVAKGLKQFETDAIIKGMSNIKDKP